MYSGHKISLHCFENPAAAPLPFAVCLTAIFAKICGKTLNPGLELPRSWHFRSFGLFGLFENLSGFRFGLSVPNYYTDIDSDDFGFVTLITFKATQSARKVDA